MKTDVQIRRPFIYSTRKGKLIIVKMFICFVSSQVRRCVEVGLSNLGGV